MSFPPWANVTFCRSPPDLIESNTVCAFSAGLTIHDPPSTGLSRETSLRVKTTELRLETLCTRVMSPVMSVSTGVPAGVSEMVTPLHPTSTADELQRRTVDCGSARLLASVKRIWDVKESTSVFFPVDGTSTGMRCHRCVSPLCSISVKVSFLSTTKTLCDPVVLSTRAARCPPPSWRESKGTSGP